MTRAQWSQPVWKHVLHEDVQRGAMNTALKRIKSRAFASNNELQSYLLSYLVTVSIVSLCNFLAHSALLVNSKSCLNSVSCIFQCRYRFAYFGGAAIKRLPGPPIQKGGREHKIF